MTGKTLYVYDKIRKRQFQTTPDAIFVKKHMYTIRSHQGRMLEVEKKLSEQEYSASQIIKKLQDKDHLSPVERSDLAEFLDTLVLRSIPAQERISKNPLKTVLENVGDKLFRRDKTPSELGPDSDLYKADMFTAAKLNARTIYNKRNISFFYIEAGASYSFITSDFPFLPAAGNSPSSAPMYATLTKDLAIVFHGIGQIQQFILATEDIVNVFNSHIATRGERSLCAATAATLNYALQKRQTTFKPVILTILDAWQKI